MTMSRVIGTPEPAATRRVAPARASAGAGENDAVAFFRQPLVPVLTCIGVLIVMVLSIKFGRTAGMISALWGAGGLAAGMWLRSGRGLSYDICFGGLIAVGIVAAELLVGNTAAQTALFTVANMAEIVTAVFLVRRFTPYRPMATVKGAIRLLVMAGVLAPLPGAIIVSVGLQLMSGGDPAAMFQTWWFGHALGFAVLIPMILAADRRWWVETRTLARLAEWAVLFTLLIGGLWFAYFASSAPTSFIVLPVLMIMAARLRTTGVALGLVLVAIFQLTAVVQGAQPSDDLPNKVLLIQLNLIFAFLPFMLLSVLLNERDVLGEKAVQAQRRAERASQAKSRLLANVAHEIKSPIGGIIGIGDLWKSGQLGPVTATQDEMAGMLVGTARQIEGLAHDLLDVARAESGSVKYELRPTDVVGVLEDVSRATAMRPDAQGLRFDVSGDGEDLVALADSQRLTQVIANLATNAVKYGSDGGVVILKAMRAGACIRVEVIDHGVGLTAEKQAQLFEPFNRLGLERSTIEGHGIGLALAKSLIEMQGGSIGVESQPGHGATFWLELPAAS
ncbi:ATP-binding protein [Brevundimonas sp. NPDC092305]|uniref:sensor histidine kinase n=1 Tax=Brevundimonas sp. NPDC092305 TaxID=3363957 RepID=UPI003821B4F1